MDPRKQRLIQLLAILHTHLKGEDGKSVDEESIISKTLAEVDKAIDIKVPNQKAIIEAVLAAIPSPVDGQDGSEGPTGKAGKSGKAGKDGATPSDEHLMELIRPLIPEAESIDKDEVKSMIESLMPESEEMGEEVPDVVVFYIQTVLRELRRSIATKTYHYSEIDGLEAYVQANAGEGSGFEYISKNLNNYDAAYSYTGSDLTSVVFTVPSVGTITKTLNYTGVNLTSVVLTGNVPAGIDTTKTLSYTGANISSIAYS